MLKYNDPLLVEKLTDMVINHESYKELDTPFTYHLLIDGEAPDTNKLTKTLKDHLSVEYKDVYVTHKLTSNKTGRVCTLIVSLGDPVIRLPHDQVQLLKAGVYDIVKDILETRKVNVHSEVFVYDSKDYIKEQEFVFQQLMYGVLNLLYPHTSLSFAAHRDDKTEVQLRINLGITESFKADINNLTLSVVDFVKYWNKDKIIFRDSLLNSLPVGAIDQLIRQARFELSKTYKIVDISSEIDKNDDCIVLKIEVTEPLESTNVENVMSNSAKLTLVKTSLTKQICTIMELEKNKLNFHLRHESLTTLNNEELMYLIGSLESNFRATGYPDVRVLIINNPNGHIDGISVRLK